MEESKFQLYPFQEKMVRHYISRYEDGTYKASYNANPVGSGKTVVAIHTLNGIIPFPTIQTHNKILCVTTASTAINWKREFEKHYKFNVPILIVDAASKLKYLHQLPNKKSKLNLESLPEIVIVGYKLIARKGNTQKLIDWNPDYVIFDEAQALKNPFIKTTKYAYMIAETAKHSWLMSATPIKNCLNEWFPYLNYVDPDETGSYWDFSNKFAFEDQSFFNQYEVKFTGGQNFDEFKKRFGHHYVKLEAKDIMHDLPPTTYQKLELYGDIEFNKQLIDLVTPDFKHYVDGFGDNQTKIIPPDVHKVRKVMYQSKHPEIMDFVINLIDQGIPILMAYRYHESIKYALESLERYAPLVITGATPGKARQGIVDEFNNGNRMILMGNIESLGVGLNIQKRCSTVVFAETGYTPDTITQFVGRVNRIGQTKPCMAYFPILSNSYDERILDTLINKAKILEEL